MECKEDVKEIVKTLKKRLPRGYTKVISEEMGCSPQNVSQIINEGRMDHPIMERAIALAKSHQKKIKKQLETLNN